MPDRSGETFAKELLPFVGNMNEIAFLLGEDRSILSASDMAARLWELEPRELVGLKIDRFFPKVYLDAIFSKKEESAGAKSASLTFSVKNNEGVSVALEARRGWVCSGEAELLLLVCREVGKYVETISKLTEREDRYKTLFHESPLGFIHVNSDGFITDCNNAFLNIFHLFRHEIIGLCLAEQNDFGAYPRFAHAAMEAVMGTSSRHETPFKSRNGEFDGWLRVTFSPVKSSSQLFLGAVGIVEDITESKRSAERVDFISTHDALTGLYNRRFCEDMIAAGLNDPDGLPLGVLYADLDGLKLANDAFGHEEGDRLLKASAAILRDTGSPDDLIFRWGGDEFIILLKKTSEEEVRARFKKIKDAAAAWNGEGFISPSLALGSAMKSTSAEAVTDVIKAAEDSMYHDKLRNGGKARSKVLSVLEARMHTLDEDRLGVRSGRMLLWADWAIEAFNLTGDDARYFRLLCRYHDIGMLSSSEELAAVRREPSDYKYAFPLQHAAVGYRIARCIVEIAPVADMILAHHEWWNGMGYPNGLKGEAIPRHSRLAAIFDALEGMVSLRPPEERLSLEDALAAIETSSGRQFDPALVEEIASRLRADPPQFVSDLEV